MTSFSAGILTEFLQQVVLILEKFSFLGVNSYIIKSHYVVSLLFLILGYNLLTIPIFVIEG